MFFSADEPQGGGGGRDTVFPLGIETRATETSVYLHTKVLEGRGRWRCRGRQKCTSVWMCVQILVRMCVGLEVLERSFLVSPRRAVVVEEKTPALLDLNRTG